jgi:hypothetical protein
MKIVIPQNIPKLAWVILAIGLAILCGGITFSLMKGWSVIKIHKAPEGTTGHMLYDADGKPIQNVAPGTPTTIKRNGKEIEIRKGIPNE